MKLLVVALAILGLGPAWARQDEPKPTARSVKFFDVLELPARIDEPKLIKAEGDYLVRCALANRSGESLVGVRLTLMFVDATNGVITRTTWNEATAVPAYSIKKFEFHPSIKSDNSDANLFLGIEEVMSRDTLWRTIDADKMLRAYARGQQSQIPKVQKLQNKFDADSPVIMRQPKLSRP